jgi:O-acetylserine/cysteine efflux transporter
VERPRPYQYAALGLAAAGLLVIALNVDGHTTPLGIGMVLLAAFSWAAGNIVSRRAGRVNMLAYVVWASLFSVPPLLLLALLVEGPARMLDGLQHAGAATWAAVLWQSVGNTLFGYAAWGWLLLRHPAATIVPWALLVPVFGMATSSLWLGEPLPPWKLAAAGLVVAGLALNLWWPAWRAAWKR